MLVDAGSNPTWSGVRRTDYIGAVIQINVQFREVSVMEAS